MVLCPFTSPQNVNLSKVENFPMRTGHGQNPANHRLDVYNPKNNEISNNQPIWCLQDFFHQQYQFRKNWRTAGFRKLLETIFWSGKKSVECVKNEAASLDLGILLILRCSKKGAVCWTAELSILRKHYPELGNTFREQNSRLGCFDWRYTSPMVYEMKFVVLPIYLKVKIVNDTKM